MLLLMIEASYSVIMYISSQISVVSIYKWEYKMAGIIGSGKYAEVGIFHMKVHSVPLGSSPSIKFSILLSRSLEVHSTHTCVS
jgi:hypothetical protein